MPSKKARFHPASAQLLRLAEEFRRLDWDRWLPLEEPLALAFKGSLEPWHAVRVTAEDGGIQLLLFIGGTARADFLQGLTTPRLEHFLELEMLELSYATAREVTTPFLRLHAAAGLRPTPAQLVPVPSAKGRQESAFRPLRASEVRDFIKGLRLLTSMRRHPAEWAEAETLEARGGMLCVLGDPNGEFVGFEVLPKSALPTRPSLPPLPPLELPALLASLPRLDLELCVMATSLGVIEEGKPPARAFVAMNVASGVITGFDLGQDVLASPTPDTWARLFQGKLVDGSPVGLPRRILFSEETFYQTAGPALSGLGIEVRLAPDHPGFLHLFEFWRGALQELASEGADEPALTLDEWKQLDASMYQEFASDLRALDTRATRLAYYGVPTKPQPAIRRFGEEAVATSYWNWLITDYRPTPGSPTAVERRLQSVSLASAPRRLLEAVRDATLSLYRIQHIVRGKFIEVLDVFHQTEHRITDRSLSQSAEVGLLVFLRIYPVASWTFCSIAGPPLLALYAKAIYESLLDALEQSGQDDLRSLGPLIGHLWSKLPEPGTPIKLQNASGEPLRPQTLYFGVQDRGALAQALAERPDVDYVDAGREWVWLDRTPIKKLADGPTILARLQSTPKGIRVKVNSDPRAWRVQQWLEAIPGVKHTRTVKEDPALGAGTIAAPTGRRVTGPSPARLSKGRRRARPDRAHEPNDGSLPDLPPEVVAHFAGMMRQQLLAWADQPVPALQDRTPRDACRSAEGRRRVLSLIQTMPTPVVPGPLQEALDFEAVRSELLRDLGLEAQ